jgi:predicted ArsR family transcriptional regulator
MEYELTKDMLAMLRFIEETGGIHCTGSCARKKPDEVHCHAVSQELNISSSGARDRIGRLFNMGLIKCERETVKTGSVRSIFTVTPEGEKALNMNPRT